jgi:hypothetical protein
VRTTVPETTAADKLSTLARKAAQAHTTAAPDADRLWRDGINQVMQALQPLNGLEDVDDALSTQVALIITAVQSLQCAHSIALQGYFLQAANLLRAPVEFLVAAHYLRFRPTEYARFTDPGLQTPSFNDMKQGIGSSLRKVFDNQLAAEFETNIQTLINELHPYSHVDKMGVAMVTQRYERGLTIQVGPQESAHLFEACAGRAAIVLDGLILLVRMIRLDLGYPDVPNGDEYHDRLDAWVDMKAAHVCTGSEPGSVGPDGEGA